MRAARKVNENALPLNGDRNAQTQFGAVNALALEKIFLEEMQLKVVQHHQIQQEL